MMKVIKCCMVWNVVVLLITTVGLSGEDELSRDDLSVNSKLIYDHIPNDEAKKSFLEEKGKHIKTQNEIVKIKDENDKIKVEYAKIKGESLKKDEKICKLEDQNMYTGFVCATTKLKSQTEEIYPDFEDEWQNDVKNAQRINPSYKKFMQGIYSQAVFPGNKEAVRFQSIVERTKMDPKFSPHKKMRNYFYHMLAMLTRYNSPIYSMHITNQTRQYANCITHNIVPSWGDPYTILPNIIDFSRRYAHIRECFNIFAHHQNTDIIDKTVQEILKEEKAQQESKLKTNIPIKINICTVLERMGVLKEWQFTQNDIYVMNNISLAVLPDYDPIYFSHTCNCMIDGKMVEVLIPITNAENCPVFERMSSTTIIQ